MAGKRWFWLAVALQVALLLALVARHTFTVATGQPVLLKAEPVDPWDPFRGQYVELSYEISRAELGANGPFVTGQPVWVLLEQGEPFWSVASVKQGRPLVRSGQAALRAIVQHQMGEWNGEPARLFLKYGIEQFYVPEGEGAKLEQANQQGQLSVEVLVDRFGRAALHKVFAGGQEVRWR